MAEVLSFPFRALPSGSVATVEQGSSDESAELLAALVVTRLGERPLVPGFGTPDPLFTDIDYADVSSAAAIFGPNVSVTGVEVVYTGPGTQDVTITFE